ncbi:unnamed protein product [Effrenium voratum]|nr:unnamed protein product [Effrenium voratum]
MGACGACNAAIWLLLLRLQVTSAQDREIDAKDLSNAMQLKDGLNSSIALTVLPAWDLFLGFDDARKVIQGRLTVISMYPSSATRFVNQPRAIIDVENFGQGDKREMGVISVVNPETGDDAESASTVYVGDFSQAANDFEMSCYPFDMKRVGLSISIQKPGNLIFSIMLGCPHGDSESQTINGETVITKCTVPVQASYVGFDWKDFVCERLDDELIRCTMEGVRQWAPLFNSYMWPSLMFSAMGFMAFTLDVKMSMPRVATTMLALVSVTNLRNRLLNLLPSAGDISWMEEYFLVGMTFMLLNLAGHAVSFYLDSIGQKDLQRLVNKVNLWGMLSIMWLIIICRLHVRQCELVDATATAILVALSSLLVAVVFLVIGWHYRDALRDLFPRRRIGVFSPDGKASVLPIHKGAEED